MSEVAMTKVSMEKCLLDMPYEILFEIFGNLSKCKLIEISKLCSQFRDVVGDTRFWKDVHIKYESRRRPEYKVFAYEELYSEPWPVNVIDLSNTKIKPPVSYQTDIKVKVTKLNLSSISADEVTVKALLAKYQCTELCLVDYIVDSQGHIGILPETFSKQTALKVLTLGGIKFKKMRYERSGRIYRYTYLNNLQMLDLIKKLPHSLEKLSLVMADFEDSFFESLAVITPNLKELALCDRSTKVKYPSLLKFQFLEDLHIIGCTYNYQDISDFFEYLIEFPALKNFHVKYDKLINCSKTNFENLQKQFESHGITFRLTKRRELSPPANDNLWIV